MKFSPTPERLAAVIALYADRPSRFRPEYRALTPSEQEDLDMAKELAKWFDSGIEYAMEEKANQPDRLRELALSRTKLEEAVMWFVKGVTG